MAKRTLLSIVQSILSDMDGDEVNSINDTIEGTQVASVVREVYRSITEEYDLQSTETLFQLTASVDLSRPTHMTVPVDVFDVTLVRYNTTDVIPGTDKPRFKEIPYATRAEFLRLVSNRDVSDTDRYQAVTDASGVVFIVRKDSPPSMYTSFDGGVTLVFDAYDADVDDTLQTSRTQCIGRIKNDISLTDGATMDIPATLEQLVVNEAREMCFELFKDGAPRKVNEATRRSRVRAKERTNKLAVPSTLPDYGRKRRG